MRRVTEAFGSIVFLLMLFATELPSAAQVVIPVGSGFQVNTYTYNDQDWPAVAMDANGQFVVLWHDDSDRDGSRFAVWGQRHSSTGSRIGSEFLVNAFTDGQQFDPAVAMTPTGAFIAAWGSFRGSGNTDAGSDGDSDATRAQLFTSSGARNGSEFLVNTFTVRAQEIPDTVIDQAGNFVIVWNGEVKDGSQYGVFGQRYSSNGSAVGAEFMVNSYTVGRQSYPAIGMDSAANFVVVRRSVDQDGEDSGVFGQRFASNGGPLGTEFQVNTMTTYSQTFPDVQSKADGEFIVVWSGFGAVFAQRFGSAGNRLGTEFQVSLNAGYRPKVAWDTNDFLVTWVSYGSYDQILARRFDGSGMAVGSEFRVNTYTAGGHARPAIASDNAFRFVVSWRSYGQDGYGQGIFAQLLSFPTYTATVTPTMTPSATPTSTPSVTPTSTPSSTPSVTPTSTPTITPTSTSTPTPTATATPTDTPLPVGASCDDDALCMSGHCTDGVCCETACDGALEQCNLPDSVGVCTSIVAPAPATSGKGLAIAIGLVMLIAFVSLRRLRAA